MIMFPLILQKTARNSKCKDHQRILARRLELWKDGKVDQLLREGRSIQSRLTKPKHSAVHKEKVFTRLMLKGKISAALKWIGSQQRNLLDINDDVLEELKAKHPKSMTPTSNSILRGPIIDISAETIYDNINSNMIYLAAKKTSGSAGPSGADGEIWQRILCSKQFKKKSNELCEAVAELGRKLCASNVNPKYLKAYTACRLIPLDKDPGVRPIGVGEILRRIIGKAVTTLLNPALAEATAPLQTCAGIPGGVEATIHALRRIFDDPETEAVLLLDARNAFNVLNRKAALNNIKYTCPEIATYIINTYRNPAELHIANCKETLLSEEGTTQGDNTSMGLYSCSTIPLVHGTHEKADVKRIFYADDGAGGGKLKNLKVWWDIIQRDGPGYGYFPEPSKTWLITKPQFLEAAKKVFPDVNITDQGHKYLGSFIGTSEGTKSYVEKKIDKWRQDIEDLSHIAKNEPQLAYSAYTYGVSKRWMFLARTTPNIAEQMKKLEYYIRESLIPPIVGKEHIDDTSRKIFALPAKLGGLGINNPSDMSNIEYENSILATQQLTDAIVGQNTSLHIDEDEESKVKQTISKNKQDMFKSIREDLVKELSENQIKILDLASEKGASSWLTSLPLEKFGFVLNKQEFIDAMALRYNYKISNTAKTCACGQDFSVNHSLICKKGGYVALRHNTIRDTTAEILEEVCIDVVKEPMLLPVNGATLKKGSNLCDNARLDVSARGIWSPLARAFIDVRVFHPHAPSNSNKSITQMYLSHERQKKNLYNSRITEIERGTFSPIVFSTTGGMGKEAESFYKCIAMKLSIKRDQRYCETISFLRRRLRFDLLKTCIISLRGYRGQNNKSEPIRGLDYNLYRQSEF